MRPQLCSTGMLACAFTPASLLGFHQIGPATQIAAAPFRVLSL
jgi:hypothetical protein